MKRPLTMYLAGAIRDDFIKEDTEWREEVITALSNSPVTIINPVGGKTFNGTTRDWKMSGITPISDVIVPHDFWAVERSDVVLFNFRALSQRYPNIGTLIEFGHATGLHPRPLIYSIIDPDYSGHDNAKLFQLHPFIEKNSAAIFSTVDDAVDFMVQHFEVLSGMAPRFGGVVYGKSGD